MKLSPVNYRRKTVKQIVKLFPNLRIKRSNRTILSLEYINNE